MAANNNRATKINKLYQALKKAYKPLTPQERPLMETLLYACLLEDAPYEAADECMARLEQDYFDWNEVRVTTVTELREILKSLPDPSAAAVRLKKNLHSLFEAFYSFDVEEMKKLNLGKAIETLEKLPAITPFVMGYVAQHCLGGHLIAVDSAAMHLLHLCDVVTPQEAEKGKTPGLERAVQKAKGLEFTSLLHQAAVTLRVHPKDKNIWTLIRSVNPSATPETEAKLAAAAKKAKKDEAAAAAAAAAAERALPKIPERPGDKGPGKGSDKDKAAGKSATAEKGPAKGHEKSPEKAAEKTPEKAPAKVAEKPAAKSSDKSADKPAEKSVDKHAEKATDKAEKGAERGDEKKGAKLADKKPVVLKPTDKKKTDAVTEKAAPAEPAKGSTKPASGKPEPAKPEAGAKPAASKPAAGKNTPPATGKTATPAAGKAAPPPAAKSLPPAKPTPPAKPPAGKLPPAKGAAGKAGDKKPAPLAKQASKQLTKRKPK